ncbi:MAG TPA: TlpA disulfide reductase family protein [Phycisphaerales bacterium]|nr:TlpA disulfide reductase family protein [Phycisphaerales bacterium]
MPSITPIAAALLSIASSALAQTPSAGPAKADAPGAPTPAAKAAYPEKVTKKLFAKNDLRGNKAPALTVEAWRIEGKETKAPDLKNKTILIDFWGISCDPCRRLIPELEAWQEKFKGDLVVVGLSGDTPRALDNFEDLRGNKIKYTLAIDTQNRTNRDVGVEGIPHVLLVSADGIVRWQGFPLSKEEPLTEEKLKQVIDADKAARAAAAASEKKSDPAPTAAKPSETKPETKAPEKKG